ncbi:MAG: hypothetical protein IKU02_05440, partial [Bacteroidaceae bacterium]|nr:hypothetical protein [Bacteroidaceae bacterium]
IHEAFCLAGTCSRGDQCGFRLCRGQTSVGLFLMQIRHELHRQFWIQVGRHTFSKTEGELQV